MAGKCYSDFIDSGFMAKGLRMFKSLVVKNFRGFKDVKVDRLSRVTLFVGHNNIGKTAVLESLFLLLGGQNPQLTMTINVFRGIDAFVPDPNDLWGWLFRD